MKFGSFSIRSLLAFTSLVALLLAIFLGRAASQKRGREWVAAQRGHVYFEHDFDERTKKSVVPYVPQSFVQLLGVDFFNPVRTVIFDCDELVDLQPITSMPTLHTIVINIEMADSIDLSPLHELPHLQEIHFTEWSRVTDKQLAEFRKRRPDVEIFSPMDGG